MKKKVLVLFKTHLDIGYTDTAETVTNNYLTKYLPNAVKVGYRLKNTDTPFIWTVGSWLIWRALKSEAGPTVEQAIRDGILRWHALPFTTHTELMSEKLFEAGLSLSDKLDERFGFHTVGAKMSDVPGHTIGMVPIMKRHGVKFLHIGANTATPMPSVPHIFRWRCGEDEIAVMYQRYYGQTEDLGDFAVYFAHTGDNEGPQSAEQIIAEYEKIRKLYPDCEPQAATIDDLAEAVCAMKDLPVVDREIGDTWIHGAGTDPQKVSRYRKVLRALEQYPESPFDLTDNLLLIPEHTWGGDSKQFFPYPGGWDVDALAEMKQERQRIEETWSEQRAYVAKAEKLFGVTPDYPVAPPDLTGFEEAAADEVPIPCAISWQLFDNADFERYKETYLRCREDWALNNCTKVGLPDYAGGIFDAHIDKAYRKGAESIWFLSFDKTAAEKYGLPTFTVEVRGEDVTIRWFGKKASRLPQAFWLKFTGFAENWRIRKMGQWITPEEIIDSPLISAVDRGIKNDDAEIVSLDCALVAPFGRRLLQYGVKNAEQDMYFNLYNNIWNTNFPLWYADDGLFRFQVKKTV